MSRLQLFDIWFFCCLIVYVASTRHKHHTLKRTHIHKTAGHKTAEPGDDDDFVEDFKRSHIHHNFTTSRHAESANNGNANVAGRKDNLMHVPKELNWDWGAFNVKSQHGGEDSSLATADDNKRQRKTIIPLEGVLYEKTHDEDKDVADGQLKSKLAARTTKTVHPVSRRINALSRRFNLYPRWFSNSIPTLFGKHFARRYYKPYGSIESSGSASTRHHIIRSSSRGPAASKDGSRSSGSAVYHELPMSWLGDAAKRISIPKKRGDVSEALEGAVADDNLVLEQPSENVAGERTEKKAMPFLKDIPHEVMAELNPYEYTVLPGKKHSFTLLQR